MSESDNTDSDDFNFDLNNNFHDSHNSHDSDENQLWNKESLKNHTLNILNLLKFYSTFSEISSILFTVIIYWVSNKFDKDSHNIKFESWKTVFTAERLVQLKKIQQTHCWIDEKSTIIKEMMKHVMKIRQELEFFHQKQLSSESKIH